MVGGASERNYMACPKHYLKNYHPNYIDAEALRKRARSEGFSTWTQYFEAKRDMFYQSNVDLPTLGPWMLKVGIPKNPAVYVRNPYYWAVDEEGNQLPYIDEMRWTLAVDRGYSLFRPGAAEADRCLGPGPPVVRGGTCDGLCRHRRPGGKPDT